MTSYLGWVVFVIWLNSSSTPRSIVGTDGTGNSQPKSDASPEYWIWMFAVTTPLSIAKRIRSPACTTGTDGSGGAKQPQAWASPWARRDAASAHDAKTVRRFMPASTSKAGAKVGEVAR